MSSSHLNKVKQRQKYTHVGQMCHFSFHYTSEDLYHVATEITVMCHYCCFNIQVRISSMQLQKWHWCDTTVVSIYKWGSLPCSYRNDTDVPLLLFQYTSEDFFKFHVFNIMIITYLNLNYCSPHMPQTWTPLLWKDPGVQMYIVMHLSIATCALGDPGYSGALAGDLHVPGGFQEISALLPWTLHRDWPETSKGVALQAGALHRDFQKQLPRWPWHNTREYRDFQRSCPASWDLPRGNHYMYDTL